MLAHDGAHGLAPLPLRSRVLAAERGLVLASSRPPRNGETAAGTARRAARILRMLGAELGETCRVPHDVPAQWRLGILGEQTLDILSRLLAGGVVRRHDAWKYPTEVQYLRLDSEGDLHDAETGALVYVVAPARLMVETYFYGAWPGGSGHHLRDPRGQRVSKPELPWTPQVLDGGLAPRRHASSTEPAGELGYAALVERGDWTALSAWDRSVDNRPGSHATWVLKGSWSFDQAVARVKANTPDRWRLLVTQPGWPRPGVLWHA